MTDQPRRARTDLTKEELERLEKYGSMAFHERRGDLEALTEPLQRDRAAQRQGWNPQPPCARRFARTGQADELDRLQDRGASRYGWARSKPWTRARQFRRRPKSSSNPQRSFMRCGDDMRRKRPAQQLAVPRRAFITRGGLNG
jgi:hypothetical protein